MKIEGGLFRQLGEKQEALLAQDQQAIGGGAASLATLASDEGGAIFVRGVALGARRDVARRPGGTCSTSRRSMAEATLQSTSARARDRSRQAQSRNALIA